MPDLAPDGETFAPHEGDMAPGTPTTSCRFQAVLFNDDNRRDPHWSCPHSVFQDGLCVFHAPKLSAEERRKLTAPALAAAEQIDLQCRVELNQLIAQVEQSANTAEHELIGFELPPGFGLSQRTLAKTLNFRCARFHGDFGAGLSRFQAVDLRQAEFLGRLTLSSVEIQRTARFDGARFHGIAAFSSVQFLGECFFTNAVFHSDCEFAATSRGFAAFTNFNGVRFEGRATFTGHGDEPVFHGVTSFCALSFGSGASLSFSRLSLARADFYDTDLQRVRFIGVHWAQLDGRPSLWGELRLLRIDRDPTLREQQGLDIRHGAPQIEKLAECYAQLVLNYEQRRDIDTAEAFHIGEMDMRRRKLAAHIGRPWLRSLRERCNAFGVYRVSSLYGSSHTRALCVLCALLLSLALLFMVTGLVPADSGRHGATPIQYRLLPDTRHPVVAPRIWLRDFAASLQYTLAIATFQKDRQHQPAGAASAFAGTIGVLVIGAQVALLLFALRRRFKR